MLPIVLPRVSGGTSVMTVVMRSGSMIAVPDAWITRATTSSSRPGASAAASVPVENSDIARMKIARVCRRWSRKPVIGMTTAIVSRNAVVSHCAALAVTPRLAMRRGIATPMIVSFRITTNDETSSRLMTRRLRAACSVPAASVVAFMARIVKEAPPPGHAFDGGDAAWKRLARYSNKQDSNAEKRICGMQLS